MVNPTQQHRKIQCNSFIETVFLSPFFSGFFILSAMLLYYVICYAFRAYFGVFDVEEIGVTETLTYLFYGLGGGITLMLCTDYLNTERRKTYYCICFLWLCGLLREMGIQHWLTRHDSTAIKIRFFTNPNNPLHEKLITACLLLIVTGVVLYLLRNYLKPVLSGFTRFQPVDWSIVTLLVFLGITQIADRFPAEYAKATGVKLEEPVRFFLKILEEGGESLLPLVFAIALLQFHILLCPRKDGTSLPPQFIQFKYFNNV